MITNTAKFEVATIEASALIRDMLATISVREKIKNNNPIINKTAAKAKSAATIMMYRPPNEVRTTITDTTAITDKPKALLRAILASSSTSEATPA